MFSGLIRFRIVWQEHFTDGTILRGTPGTVIVLLELLIGNSWDQ